MSKIALLDATVYAGGYDFSADLNQCQMDESFEDKDVTTFRSAGARERKAGLSDTSFSMHGFWQSAASQAVDPEAFNNLGDQQVFTFAPNYTDGTVGYAFRARTFNYTRGDQVGEIAQFDLSGMGSSGGGAVRGNLLLPKQSVTGIVNGTGVQLGDVAAAENLYTAIHCFSAGTTATVIVESDDNGAFSSATTRSSTVVTAAGGTWVTPVAGSITDDYWRVRTASVTGTFSIAVLVGIQ